MKSSAFAKIAVACLIVLASGCGKNGGKTEELRTQSDLRQVGILYHGYHTDNQKPPANVDDFLKAAEKDPQANKRVIDALKGDKFVIFWGEIGGADGSDESTVLGHEKDALTKGGAVLMVSGKVKKMTAKELEEALKKNPK